MIFISITILEVFPRVFSYVFYFQTLYFLTLEPIISILSIRIYFVGKLVCGCWYHQVLQTLPNLWYPSSERWFCWYPSNERWLWRLCWLSALFLKCEVIVVWLCAYPSILRLILYWLCALPLVRGYICLREELCTPNCNCPNPQWRFLVWEVLCGRYSEKPSVWRRERRAGCSNLKTYLCVCVWSTFSKPSLLYCVLHHIIHIIYEIT